MMTGHFLKILIFFLTKELAFHVWPIKAQYLDLNR